MRRFTLFFAVLLYSYAVYAQPSNDDFANAIDVTSVINSCSSDAAYTTLNATGDLNAGSTWNTSPDNNVWFSVTAPASGIITVTVDIGGAKGSMLRANVAIWESDGTTEVNSNRYVNNADDVSTTGFGLTPGNTYYISVDNNYSPYEGTFTLCLSDQADYDFYEGAIDVTSLINSCSADAAYSTEGATADRNPGSTWNTSPNYNRWFSFTAPASGILTVTVDIGGTKGDMLRTNVAIWEADGNTEVVSNRYVNNANDVSTTALGLTPGNTYYISVDNNYDNYRGTFSLCLSDQADYDFYEGAIDITSLINNCSADAAYTTVGATADRNAGSTWNTSPNYNRWFSFTAPASGELTVTVDIGGVKGDMLRTNVAIWEADGTTEVVSNRYVNNSNDVSTTALGLTPGNTYYISVDNNYDNYRGTFSLCLSDQADYDFYEGAIDITSLINNCSADAAYTTVGATGDRNPGSTWNTSPNYNRWFSFTAPATGMLTVTVDIGGVKGDMLRTNVAIWEADGTTEVVGNRYVNNGDDVSTTALGLTPGNTYYISVDNNIDNYRGTFSLCLSDQADYDFYEGAIDVTSLINSCSSDAAYTTIGGTADRNPGSTWNTSPNYNRWFSFTAPATGMLTVTVDIGGVKGDMLRTNVAIWEADGTTEVVSNRYVNNGDDVSTTALGLTPGNTYYISVDNNYSSYRGTFTLCLSDQADYDFYEGAIDVTSIINSCSADAAYNTEGGTPDRNPGSTWNTSPNYNRWFSFTAPASGRLTVTVDIGGTKGDMLRTNVAIWEADGTTEVVSNRYVNNADDVSTTALGLIPGNTYYISVDNNYSSYRGGFTLCLSDQADYDFYEGAIDITSYINTCTSDAIYNTEGATPDRNAGSSWNTSPNYNRWFSFVAPASGRMTVTVDIGGTQGDMLRTNVAIWEADGTTEVSSNRYVNNADDVSTTALGLTPGNTYYISVDNNYSSYRGSFTLCLSDEADYDFYEGAYEITDVDNWCSSDAQFTTIGATPDQNAASCWNTSPNYNRWFRFVAQTSNASIQVQIGGSLGSVLRVNLALWESDGTTEVACARYSSNGDNVSIVTTGLVPGNTYYISVDNNYSSYRGTFTLCVDNINQTYYSISTGVWPDGNNWSLVDHTGPAAGTYPIFGDIAIIEGHEITISGSENASGVELNANTLNTGLIINGGDLDVTGRFEMNNTGANVNTDVTLTNASLSIFDSFVMDRSGGNGTFSLSLTNSSININRDMDVSSSAGSTDNVISLASGSLLDINEEFILSNTGGPRIEVNIDGSSLNVSDNVTFSATSDNEVEINLVSSSDFYLGNSILRGSPAYGNVTNDGTSMFHFNSTNNLQEIPASAGSGTGDVIDYINITVNNTRVASPMLELEGEVSISGSLVLQDGIIETSSSAMLLIEDGASASSGSANSFVDGPMKKIGASDFIFPLGNNERWAGLSIANLTGDAATEFEAQYHFSGYMDVTNILSPDPNGDMENVSTVEYWDLTNSGTASSADVSLHWDRRGTSGIQDASNLVVAHYNTGASQWENMGQDVVIDADPGYVRANGLSSFSPFTLGSLMGNALPVELIFVDGVETNEGVLISWATAVEISNSYFEIQRSSDGIEYQSLGTVKGAGDSGTRIDYKFLDEQPIVGISYYRIKQVDFDGRSSYSDIVRVEVRDRSLVLFPNPVTDQQLSIRLSTGATGVVAIRVINLLGHEVHLQEADYTPNTIMNIQLPLQPLSNGLYIIEIYVEGIVYREQVIIDR